MHVLAGHEGLTEHQNASGNCFVIVVHGDKSISWFHGPARAAGFLCAKAHNPNAYPRAAALLHDCSQRLLSACHDPGFELDRKRVFRAGRCSHARADEVLVDVQERGNKELGIAARVVQVAEKVALGATALVWLQLSHSGSARNVLSTFGVMYAWEATQLIVAHMTKEPIVTTWWPTAIVALSAANAYVGVVEPGLVAVIVNGVIIVAYLRYGICVVGEICEALNINCLTIKHKKSS